MSICTGLPALSFRLGFHMESRYLCGSPPVIEGDIDQPCGIGVRHVSRKWILGADAHAYLQRRLADVVDRRLAADQLANPNRGVKRHRVDPDRDTGAARVTHRADRAGLVHHSHDSATVHLAERIGVFRQGQATDLDT